jgi:uncharacterized alpha-E superfamily protein
MALDAAKCCACDVTYTTEASGNHGAKVIQFLIFDEDNPSSIRASIKTARNNGRAVRTALTRDVWESINTTWNELAQVKPSSITADRLPVFLDWIKQRVMSFRGALLGTMLRNDTYYFSQVGNFLERADNTARILDVKYFILLPKPTDVGSELDMQQWAQILRSVSAHRSYRWFYRDSKYRPWMISEFLILKEEMPRSLVFSYIGSTWRSPASPISMASATTAMIWRAKPITGSRPKHGTTSSSRAFTSSCRISSAAMPAFGIHRLEL